MCSYILLEFLFHQIQSKNMFYLILLFFRDIKYNWIFKIIHICSFKFLLTQIIIRFNFIFSIFICKIFSNMPIHIIFIRYLIYWYKINISINKICFIWLFPIFWASILLKVSNQYFLSEPLIFMNWASANYALALLLCEPNIICN